MLPDRNAVFFLPLNRFWLLRNVMCRQAPKMQQMEEFNQMKRIWTVFAVTLALVLPLRVFAALRYLDPQTGFYSDGGKVVGAASVLLIAGILFLMVLVHRSPVNQTAPGPVKDVPTALLGALAGVFVLVQSVVGLSTGIPGEGRVFYLIFSAAGILAGAVLILYAYDSATGLRSVGSRPLLALIPSVWGCLFLVFLFITYSAVVNLVEDVYHTFTVVFLLLFLFVQAKLLTGIESEKSGKMIYMAGLPAALLALVTGVPSCIQYFSTGKTAGVLTIGMHMANIVLAFYILAFLAAVGRRRSAPEKAEASAAKTPPLPQIREEKPNVKPEIQKDSLSGYVDFLKKTCRSGEKFVSAAPSPFCGPDHSGSEES